MKRMLFNATQAEELRVAIVDGQKLIDLDIESAAKEQRKSNIYKAVITRIEPSLEAAFVDYGAERHGFLPFKEVSRSYFKPGIDAGRARIQDALAVGQEIIVQVEKDERGNKGAALTTFISLAGRYLVLMPNNPRGGGVSRRVEGDERQELRDIMDQLDVPQGMSLIARTAGIGRSKEELEWDMNYLMQLWLAIEGAAKSQSGAFLIYLESSLVIRAIRDYFHADIGEILIDTDDIFEQAQHFMATVMPSNVSRIKRYRDDVPLFSRFQIEHQIESAYSRQVTLPSGGAIVIDHTEALVSVDVNSGRATKGSDIEETALRTNCEAADEIARQLRLRDLGGLIVIDFIDMESTKNQREVENRLRDALHFDRARVQMGKISRFGLLELSRQRLRPALAEASYITCPRCTGTGHIRSTESAALHILRILEEEAMKENTGAVHCQVPVDVGTFLLNEKRVDIARIEVRHRINLMIVPNRHLETPQHEIVRLRHDQLNAEGTALLSYQMAEQAEKAAEDATYQPPSVQNEAKATKPEAAVKGITPDQPAPVVEPKARIEPETKPASKAEGGFFSRIVSFFTGGSKEEPAAEPKSETKPARRDRGERGERNGRDRGGRGRQGRDNREGREGREERNRADGRPSKRDDQQPKRDEADNAQREGRRPRGERADNRRDEPREAREPREPREPREAREPRPERNRDERPPRPARNEASLTGETQTSDAQTSTPVENIGATPAAEGEVRRRGRRGGRGRGEKRNEESAANAVAPETSVAAATPAPKPMPWPTPIKLPEPAAASVAKPVDIEPSAPVEPAAAVAPVGETAMPVQTAPAAMIVPTAPVFTLPAEESPALVPSAAVAPVTETQAAVAPTTETPTAVTPVAPPPAPVDLSASLQQVGLVMIETSSAAPIVVPAGEPQPQLGRRPKPRVVIADEPLQMVETKGN